MNLDEDKNMTDIIVIGAGPTGVLAALRAAELGAHTALVPTGGFESYRSSSPQIRGWGL